MNNSNDRIKLSIDCEPNGKNAIFQARKPNNEEYARMRERMTPTSKSLGKIAQFICKGMAIQPVEIDKRGGKEFVSQQLFVIDIDNKDDGNMMTVGMCASIANKHKVPFCWTHTTFSHTKERHKFHIFFLSDIPVTNESDAITIRRWLVSLFPQADSSCCDTPRMFQGTNDKKQLQPNPNKFEYVNIIQKAKAFEKEEQKKKVQTQKKKISDNPIINTYGDDPKNIIKENYTFEYMEQYRLSSNTYKCPRCKSGQGNNKTGVSAKDGYTSFICWNSDCNWQGDIIAYHMTEYNLNFINAIQELCEMFNIEYHQKRSAPTDGERIFNIGEVIEPETISTAPTEKNFNFVKEVDNTENTPSDLLTTLNTVKFTPNNTINFIKGKCVEIPTGGGKTYNLEQICLNKIINKTGNPIMIITSSNTLVNDFCNGLVSQIKKLYPTDGADNIQHMATDDILNDCNIFKLNLHSDSEAILTNYDIIVTNQSYLFYLGDTIRYSKKIMDLGVKIREGYDIDIYIDECHEMGNYEYIELPLYKMVIPLDNPTTKRTQKQVKGYFEIDKNGGVKSAQKSYKKSIYDNPENGIKSIKYDELGGLDFEVFNDITHIKNEEILECVTLCNKNEKTCTPKIERVTKMLDVIIDEFDLSENMKPMKEILEHALDMYMIQNSLVLWIDDENSVEVKDGAEMLEAYKKYFPNDEKKIATLRRINGLFSLNDVQCFSQTLRIVKPEIFLGDNVFYTTATTDIISKKYPIVKPKFDEIHGITDIKIMFAPVNLAYQLDGKNGLNILNLDEKIRQVTTILLSEKRKVLNLSETIDKKMYELFQTVIHYEGKTFLKVNDTKRNDINTLIKIAYLQETRQTGANWNDTELLIIDCKRSINILETFNRYYDRKGDLQTVYKSVTLKTFEHTKQAIGRILRHGLKNKTIVFCVPNPKDEEDVTNWGFHTFEFIEYMKNYFATTFPSINVTYDEKHMSETNKSRVVDDVMNFIGVTEKPTQIKKKRDEKIVARASELLEKRVLKATIEKMLADEFNLKERQVRNILSDKQIKLSNDLISSMIVNFCDEQPNANKKTIMELINDTLLSKYGYELSKSKFYRLYDIYGSDK